MLAGGNITVGGDVNYNYIPDNLITGIADEVAKRLRAEQVSPPRDNRDQVKHELVGAINDLPEQEKVVVTLHYFEGLEFSEVAKVLGLSVDDTRGIHRIALQQIAAAIALSFLRDDYE